MSSWHNLLLNMLSNALYVCTLIGLTKSKFIVLYIIQILIIITAIIYHKIAQLIS